VTGTGCGHPRSWRGQRPERREQRRQPLAALIDLLLALVKDCGLDVGEEGCVEGIVFLIFDAPSLADDDSLFGYHTGQIDDGPEAGQPGASGLSSLQLPQPGGGGMILLIARRTQCNVQFNRDTHYMQDRRLGVE